MASGIIFQWLDRIGLGYAIANFQAQGITTPQALMALDFNSYDELGIRAGECTRAPRFSLLTTFCVQCAQ
jgi:hypothetical protein